MIGNYAAAFAKAYSWIETSSKSSFISGGYVSVRSNHSVSLINPSDLKELASLNEASLSDIDQAAQAASAALVDRSWFRISPHVRASLLARVADLIDENGDELAAIESLEMGAPILFSRGRISASANMFRYYAGWCAKVYGKTIPIEDGKFIMTVREPVGVCALITSWNAPVSMAATKMAPALAVGNTVLLKPSEYASLSTLRLVELIHEAGIPAGVVNVIVGVGAKIGDYLTSHPLVSKVSFTGSTSVGKHIVRQSAENLSRVTVELGGKSANMIFDDASLDVAVKAAAMGFCKNSGQVCSAGSRLLVQERVYDEVVEKLLAQVSSFRLGPAWDMKTDIGPIANLKQFDSICGHVEGALADGARLLTSSASVNEGGYYLAPVVFGDVQASMRIATEEVFGPVLSVIRFKDADEAIHIANSSEYGLAAAIWTNNLSRAHRLVSRVQAGRVWVNSYGVVDAAMSVGGLKKSGYGKEMGDEAIDSYSQSKSVYMSFFADE